jgi:microcystin-dependent protein
MGASITLAGENLIAQKQAAKQGLDVVRFIFANVPGLDPSGPVDRAAPKPAAGQIVHVYDIPDDNAGYVNPNQVVYSSQIGSDVGDWDFNWIGLETAEGVLFAVAYVPLQIKRRNIPPLQIGNNLTRNFLVAFDGAQMLTGITIDASTWQHDFTVRLAGIDERERLSNRDIFGRACFFGASLQLVKVGSTYQLKPGSAYIEGIRLVRSAALAVVPPAFPTTAWLDVALQRELSDVVASWNVVFAVDRPDYTDSAGVRHYCVAIADLPNAATITDRRSVELIDGPLVTHFAARTGDYEHLRARATTKEDVGLGNLPNAKSDDPMTNSSEILATTAALNRLNQQVSDSLVGMVASFDMPSAPPGWLKRNGANVSRTAYAKLFAVLGTRYGAGDGSTTFNVGDSRGLFTRGLDDGRGIDPNRGLGSLQAPANLTHTHGGVSDFAGHHAHYSAAGSGGNVTVNYGSQIAVAPTGNTTTGTAGSHQHTLTIYADGDTEARPINEALLVCIKY